jgi:biopolymer transport protein TolR
MAGLLGMRHSGELRPAADINVTSLVDVAFVLLIIFMITAPIMQGGVDVQLPRAEARPLQPKEGLVVSINRSGQIFVDETALSFEDFRAAFPAMVAARKPTGIYLRGDQRVQYGVIVRVLAVMRQSGIADVGLVAEAEDIGR